MSLTHQEIGLQQRLFLATLHLQGVRFFLPHGTIIYNKLREFLCKEYRKRGYKEVITPNIAHTDLWKKSGHYDKYRANMFLFKINDVDSHFKNKIRDAEQLSVNHILVVGNKGQESSGVNLRSNGSQKYYTCEEYLKYLKLIA